MKARQMFEVGDFVETTNDGCRYLGRVTWVSDTRELGGFAVFYPIAVSWIENTPYWLPALTKKSMVTVYPNHYIGKTKVRRITRQEARTHIRDVHNRDYVLSM